MSKAITAWPWGIEQAAETLWVGPLRPDGEKVEQVVVALNYDAELTTAAKTRQLSNALLIAAAPELLDELLMLCNMLDGEQVSVGIEAQVCFARAVIAKALGMTANG